MAQAVVRREVGGAATGCVAQERQRAVAPARKASEVLACAPEKLLLTNAYRPLGVMLIQQLPSPRESTIGLIGVSGVVALEPRSYDDSELVNLWAALALVTIRLSRPW